MQYSRLWSYAAILAGTVGCSAGGTDHVIDPGLTHTNRGAALDRRHGDGGLFARGRYHVTVPPSVFGTMQPIQGQFHFDASKTSDGTVTGWYSIEEYVDGTTFHYQGTITCFGDYDFNGLSGNRAKLGGVLTASDDPTSPIGTYLWWQSIDNDHPPAATPNQTTLAGGGDQAANEAFCASSNPPKYGPFAAFGDLEVEAGGADKVFTARR